MVSVVILSENPPKQLFDDLKNQTFKDFEVIVAKEKGLSRAMNAALVKAKGDILVRIDDDVRLTDNWLSEIVSSFTDFSIAGVTGPTFVPALARKNRDSIRYMENPNWFIKWLFDNDPYAPAKIYNCGSVSYGSNFMEHIDQTKEYEIDHLEGTNWAVKIDLIRRVGGWDERFDGVGEWFDDDLLFKIKKLGYKIKYNPKAIVWHILTKGDHFNERFDGVGRLKNWLRFHWRHSKFHYKKVIWFFCLSAYFLKNYIQCKKYRS